MSVTTTSLVSSLVVLLLVQTVTATGLRDGVRKVVQTHQGPVRGTNMTSSEGRPFLAFYNLPYARPPVGILRFQAPQPPEPWVRVRDATSPGPVCTQNTLLGPSITSGIEDCLYLDVFTPATKPKKLLPVMVWIHGGSWTIGGGNWIEPGYLLNNDIVLVTFNYRLGPLGFLTTGDDAAPGNFGFKDMVAALKWVQNNIAAFGGNRKKVTIFGENAGGASVHYLMLSPLAKGLFQRAISQSGVAFVPWAVPMPDAVDKGRRLARLLGCPSEPSAEMVQCLRTIDHLNLTATEAALREWLFNPLVTFRPAVEGNKEGSFLPKHPLNLRPHSSIPWIVGVVYDVGGIETAVLAGNETLLSELRQNMERLFPITLIYHFSPNAQLITRKINNCYFPTGDISLPKLTEMYSGGLFNWNVDEAIRKHKETAPVYYYIFSYPGVPKVRRGAEEFLRVTHSDDLLYFFPNNTFTPVVNEKSEKDLQIVKVMTSMWTNFAITGNPTPRNQPLHWPQVTSSSLPQYLNIDEKLEVMSGPFQRRIKFWNSLPLRETTQLLDETEDEPC